LSDIKRQSDLSENKNACFRKSKPRAIGGHKATGPNGIAGLPKKQRCWKRDRQFSLFWETLPAFSEIDSLFLFETGFFLVETKGGFKYRTPCIDKQAKKGANNDFST
jgi:hypothetical protein